LELLVPLVILVVLIAIVCYFWKCTRAPSERASGDTSLEQSDHTKLEPGPSTRVIPADDSGVSPSVDVARHQPRAAQKPPARRSRYQGGGRVSPSEVFSKNYVSYTRLKLYHQCPRRFELVYLAGRDDPVGKPAELGSVVHKMLEMCIARTGPAWDGSIRIQTAKEIIAHFEGALASVRPRHSIARAEVFPYCQNFITLNRAPLHVVETERTLEGMIGSRRFKCVIDRIDRTQANGLVLVDYKTGRPEYADERQLNMYAYALCTEQPRPVRLQFQFLKTGQTKEWGFTPSLQQSTADWVESSVKQIESATSFAQRRGPLCRYCGVSRFCD